MMKATALIYAGGESRRMGRDKRLLAWGNTTLVQHAIDTASGTCSDVIALVRHVDFSSPSTIRFVCDDPPNLGPIGALHAGLAAARYEHCVTLACDSPFMSGEMLVALLGHLQEHDAAVLVSERGLEPMYAAWNVRIRPQLARYIGEGGRSLTGFMETSKAVCRVDLRSLGFDSIVVDPFVNLNTPHDYAAALPESERP